ncbi:MAG: flagellar motor switch phosphatase FliY [Bacillota bacterium]|jgi:flagellar motor switch protein FliN/FliY
MVDIEITDQKAEFINTMPLSLSSIESDTIGEILNISMGSAATAVSTLLNQRVTITTPRVSIVKSTELEISNFEPAIGIEIKYIEGLNGSNFMVMKRRDIRTIVNLLINGEVGDGTESELDEIQISAISEIMNQMMGASSTALASFFGKKINISTPEQFEPNNIKQIIEKGNHHEYVVSVMFVLQVEGILDSEFVTLMPIDFTKELVANVMNFIDDISQNDNLPTEPSSTQELPPPPSSSSQITATMEPASPQSPPEQSLEHAATPGIDVNRPGNYNSSRAAAQQPVSVQMFKPTNFDEEKEPESPDDNQDNFNLIMGVPLEVSVEIGKTRLPVKNILEIRHGSIIELDRQAGDPADIIINGQLIAKGDIVVIDDNFGIRITEILSRKDIAKQLN